MLLCMYTRDHKMTTKRVRKPGKWIYRLTRHAIYKRDNWTCTYCQKQDLTCKSLSLDHLICWSHGGEDKPRNLVTCCLSCNSKRKDKKLAAWYKYMQANLEISDARIDEIKKSIRKARRTSAGQMQRLRDELRGVTPTYIMDTK